MRKQRKKQQSKKRKPQDNAKDQAELAIKEKRDRLLKVSRRVLFALPVAAAVGYFSVGEIQASIHESDLTRISEGKPSIVQIHDPQCSLCQTLQRQARKAMKPLDQEEFTYLVANIRTQEGSEFSARYGVPHVTLLLFDDQGEMVQIIRGPSDVESLQSLFSAHLESYR
ncbi:MAG: hypothetical protein COA78_38245 [Blastopirellula sp.]|nr:MAG: hypothetical protein COA78_38245 [Blastopirellula sp.]